MARRANRTEMRKSVSTVVAQWPVAIRIEDILKLVPFGCPTDAPKTDDVEFLSGFDLGINAKH